MQATLSWCQFLRAPFGPAAKMSPQSLPSFGGFGLAEPASARTISYRRSLCAQTTLANAHYAERFTANPERPARTPHALQEAEIRSWLPNRRGLLGFAGLASHIRPLLASIPSCSVPEAKILPTATAAGNSYPVSRSYRYY